VAQLKTIVVCLAILVGFAQASAEHYYGGGHEIPLQVDSSLVVIRLNDVDTTAKYSIVADVDRITAWVQDGHVIDDFQVFALSSGDGYYAFLDTLAAMGTVYAAEPYYRNSRDSTFMVGLRFVVRFNETVTSQQIDSINASMGTVIDHAVMRMPNVFVLRNTDSSDSRLLDLANAYYDLPETEYSHPEFSVTIAPMSPYRVYDYYSFAQDHIAAVIGDLNEASVWDFAGLTDTVVVAVIDDGIAPHDDLHMDRILPGYDFAEHDNNPVAGPTKAHGMGCAGIIGASHTLDSLSGTDPQSGVFSMNPNTLIIPMKIFNDLTGPSYTSPSDIAAAIIGAYANGADVLNCSWGYPFIGSPGDQYDVLDQALEWTVQNGRDGKGSPLIFAAGNYAAGTEEYPGILYPACMPPCFSVGAIEWDDRYWWYSAYGTGLDLVAPSGNIDFIGDMWTLDQMSGLGYNPTRVENCPPKQNDQDYMCNFGGTSGAAAIVSGTASLLLAKDPDLTAVEVYEILRQTARRNLQWGTVTPPDWHYGYGRVDAFRAISSISRGDANNDGTIDVGDLNAIIDEMFISYQPPFPDPLLSDCDCNGQTDVGDLTDMIDHLFISYAEFPYPCFEFGD